MDNTCGSCKGRIQSHNHVLKCSVCLLHYHRTCLPLISKHDFHHLFNNDTWSCCRCNASIFPFNHFDDHCDVINAISETWLIHDLYTLPDLEKRLFSPFEIDEIEGEIDDHDPDINFFNQLNISAGSSEYYCDKKFNNIIASLNTKAQNPVSFLSLNIRSIPKNMDKLSAYLSLLDLAFTFIGVTETWFNSNNFDLYGMVD